MVQKKSTLKRWRDWKDGETNTSVEKSMLRKWKDWRFGNVIDYNNKEDKSNDKIKKIS